MKTIVALVDFSDMTPRLLDHAAVLTKALAARLILLHVVPEEPAVVELGIASPTILREPSERKIAADYDALIALRDSLTGSSIAVSAEQLEHASVEKVLDHCRKLEAEMIVVGAHQHSALYQLFVGSFTSDVLKKATCPVLVVPAVTEAHS
jgi:nucleotide-binding universal stress UspA family protein